MADESRMVGPSISKFDGGNFQVWKFQMRSVLVANRLFGLVDGSKPQPGDTARQTEKDKWIEDDARAMTFLTCAMTPTHVENVLTCKMDTSEPAIHYVTRIVNMARALKDLGEVISDAAIIAKVLGG
uniref:Retrotransposon Copia-like N-terminal domain-containing protein n=1 Tax=Trichogramma kaykai TaxID=54128 RepID=A0ABD2XS84_9HYME